MKAPSRGTAMIETAIVLSMVLLLLYGTMQIAIWGYSQATTEGAAFVGAHAASVNSSGSASTDQTYGISVANLAFPNLSASGGGSPFNFTLTYPTTNTIQAIVTNSSVTGLLLLPKASQTVSVSGGDIEPILANSGNGGSTFGGFGVQATLYNYCYFDNKKNPQCPSSGTPIYIAQYDDIYGKGNGKNGQFAEWNCRPALFPAWGSGYFPTSYSSITVKTGAQSTYDPGAGSSFGEASLYQFDSQSSKWGSQSSC